MILKGCWVLRGEDMPIERLVELYHTVSIVKLTQFFRKSTFLSIVVRMSLGSRLLALL